MGKLSKTHLKTALDSAFHRRHKLATVVAGVLAMVLAYHVIFGQNGLTVFEKKRSDNHSLNQKLETLTHENEVLRAHVDRLKEDPNAIEHEARETLHYTHPGEVIYTLPPDPQPSK